MEVAMGAYIRVTDRIKNVLLAIWRSKAMSYFPVFVGSIIVVGRVDYAHLFYRKVP
jgi:hypothetical protein